MDVESSLTGLTGAEHLQSLCSIALVVADTPEFIGPDQAATHLSCHLDFVPSDADYAIQVARCLSTCFWAAVSHRALPREDVKNKKRPASKGVAQAMRAVLAAVDNGFGAHPSLHLGHNSPALVLDESLQMIQAALNFGGFRMWQDLAIAPFLVTVARHAIDSQQMFTQWTTCAIVFAVRAEVQVAIDFLKQLCDESVCPIHLINVVVIASRSPLDAESGPVPRGVAIATEVFPLLMRSFAKKHAGKVLAVCMQALQLAALGLIPLGQHLAAATGKPVTEVKHFAAYSAAVKSATRVAAQTVDTLHSEQRMNAEIEIRDAVGILLVAFHAVIEPSLRIEFVADPDVDLSGIEVPLHQNWVQSLSANTRKVATLDRVVVDFDGMTGLLEDDGTDEPPLAARIYFRPPTFGNYFEPNLSRLAKPIGSSPQDVELSVSQVHDLILKLANFDRVRETTGLPIGLLMLSMLRWISKQNANAKQLRDLEPLVLLCVTQVLMEGEHAPHEANSPGRLHVWTTLMELGVLHPRAVSHALRFGRDALGCVLEKCRTALDALSARVPAKRRHRAEVEAKNSDEKQVEAFIKVLETDIPLDRTLDAAGQVAAVEAANRGNDVAVFCEALVQCLAASPNDHKFALALQRGLSAVCAARAVEKHGEKRARLATVASNFVAELCLAVCIFFHAWSSSSFEAADDAAVTVQVCDRIATGMDAAQITRCPSGHRLHRYFGVTWACNVCGSRTDVTSLACRQCNFDICVGCQAKRLGLRKLSPFAVVGDVVSGGGANVAEKTQPNAPTLFPRYFVLPKSEVPTPHLPTARALAVTSRTPLKFTLASAGDIQAQPNVLLHVVRDPTQRGCACGRVAVDDTPHAVPSRSGSDAPELSDAEREWVAAAIEANPLAKLAVHAAVNSPSDMCLSGVPKVVEVLLRVASPSLQVAARLELFRDDCAGYEKHLREQRPEFESIGSPFLAAMENEVLKQPTMSLPRGIAIINRDNVVQVHTALTNALKPAFNFVGEPGFGEGPTQEVYTAMVTTLFEDSRIWTVTPEGWLPCDDSATGESAPTSSGVGLSELAQRVVLLGSIIARAILDAYPVPTKFHPLVWEAATSAGCVSIERVYQAVEGSTAAGVLSLLKMNDTELEALCLETDSGDELCAANVGNFVASRMRTSAAARCRRGVQLFGWGFNSVVTGRSIQTYLRNEELPLVCGGTVDAIYFTATALRSAITPTQGYTADSPQIGWLIHVVSQLGAPDQRAFVEFLTGTTALPAGGWQSLSGPISVAKKDFDNGNKRTLPSCSTCFLLLKLPPYESEAELERALLFAIRDGRQNFSLS